MAYDNSHVWTVGEVLTAANVTTYIKDNITYLYDNLVTALILHASRHENGGADEISVAGLSGTLADDQNPVNHASDHENGGGDEISILGLSGLAADDQHVLDAEVLAVAAALVHASRHENGGADELDLDGLNIGSEYLLGCVTQQRHMKIGTYAGNSSGAQRQITTGFTCQRVWIHGPYDGSDYTPADWTLFVDSSNNLCAHWGDSILAAAATIYLHATDGFYVGAADEEANRTGYDYYFIAFG